jgi:hypothetical protein
MSKHIARAALAITALLLLAGLSGCPGGGDPPTPGRLNLAITDTPVDGADKVVVAFTGVELMGPGGQTNFKFTAERKIDLLKLQGDASAKLLDDVAVPAGDYQWIRLDVVEADSYLVTSAGGTFPLFVPSGSQSGLKLMSGFTVAQGSIADFIIDFDLRKSLTLDNHGGTTTYTLNPVLRLIDMQQVGSVSGTIASTLSIGGTLINATNCSPTVYVYSGSTAIPEGYAVFLTGGTAPLTSATVSLDNTSGEYGYTVGFLAPGTYTLAVTCAAADTAGATSLAFSASKPATVTADSTTIVDF